MTAKLSGACLCGAVSYESSEDAVLSAHCACEDCRKVSGTSHCTHVVVKTEGLTVTGALKHFDKPADSGNVVRRHFCGECGSPVMNQNPAMPVMSFLSASSLNDLSAVKPAMLVYASRAPEWLTVPEGTISFPEMPPEMPKEVMGG